MLWLSDLSQLSDFRHGSVTTGTTHLELSLGDKIANPSDHSDGCPMGIGQPGHTHNLSGTCNDNGHICHLVLDKITSGIIKLHLVLDKLHLVLDKMPEEIKCCIIIIIIVFILYSAYIHSVHRTLHMISLKLQYKL